MHDRDATIDESYLRVTMLFNLVFTSLSDQLLNVCVLVIHFQPEKKSVQNLIVVTGCIVHKIFTLLYSLGNQIYYVSQADTRQIR